MKIPGRRRITRSARMIRSRLVEHGVILGYHRIEARDSDPFDLCVSPTNFAEQLEVLCHGATITPLSDMAFAAAEGRVPANCVALTFDDGYRDYLVNALPLMQRAGIPSTIFIASGLAGREFWWDRLARVLTGVSPDTSLPQGILTGIDRDRWTKIGETEHPRLLTEEAYQTLLSLTPAQRGACLKQLEDWRDECGMLAPQNDENDRVLEASEISRLASNELVEIGAHTLTHPMLARLDLQQQQDEVQGGKVALEEMTGMPVHAFSYPNGSKSADTMALVRRCGFRYACASEVDVVWNRSKVFDLPRVWVPDIGGDEFRRWLGKWIRLS